MTMINNSFLSNSYVANRAIVFDEQQMVSDGLKALLLQTGKFEHVANFSNLDDVLAELDNSLYNFLFIDTAQGMEFRQLVQQIKRNCPNFIVIVVTATYDMHTARKAFEAGVNSYISKYVGSTELKIAIKKNQMGEKYISSDFMQKIAISATCSEPSFSLTEREIEIMNFVAKGFTIAKTASLMHLSQHTIISHRRNIMQKLNIHSAVEITKYAISNRYVVA